jgi:hypothetical protein
MLANTLFIVKNKLGENQMVNNTSLEKRLAAVEAQLAQLQRQVATSQPTNWLQ